MCARCYGFCFRWQLAEVKAGRESDAALLNRQHQREVESLKREADKDKVKA